MKRRPYYMEEKNRYSYQKEYSNFDIKDGDAVLDIGSGHYPFPYATVLVDLYTGDNQHRSEPLSLDNRPFIVADIEKLPFTDKSFDFVYCSHVLEHSENPVKACQEIMRVGKRGYVETPNFGKDILFGWAGKTGHKWYTVAIANKLLFFEYTEMQKRSIGLLGWNELIFAPYYHPLQDAFWKNQGYFNTMLLWEERFNVIVFRCNGTIETL